MEVTKSIFPISVVSSIKKCHKRVSLKFKDIEDPLYVVIIFLDDGNKKVFECLRINGEEFYIDSTYDDMLESATDGVNDWFYEHYKRDLDDTEYETVTDHIHDSIMADRIETDIFPDD